MIITGLEISGSGLATHTNSYTFKLDNISACKVSTDKVIIGFFADTASNQYIRYICLTLNSATTCSFGAAGSKQGSYYSNTAYYLESQKISDGIAVFSWYTQQTTGTVTESVLVAGTLANRTSTYSAGSRYAINYESRHKFFTELFTGVWGFPHWTNSGNQRIEMLTMTFSGATMTAVDNFVGTNSSYTTTYRIVNIDSSRYAFQNVFPNNIHLHLLYSSGGTALTKGNTITFASSVNGQSPPLIYDVSENELVGLPCDSTSINRITFTIPASPSVTLPSITSTVLYTGASGTLDVGADSITVGGDTLVPLNELMLVLNDDYTLKTTFAIDISLGTPNMANYPRALGDQAFIYGDATTLTIAKATAI